MTRTRWGVILVAGLVLGWFAPYQALWVSCTAAFLIGVFSGEIATRLDKWLGR